MADIIQIKVLFVGDKETGAKTSLIKCFTDGSFSEFYAPSVGVDFRSKDIDVCDMEVSVQLWDTAGSSKFRSTITTYYRIAHCFVVGYSITDRASFENLPKWITSIKEKGFGAMPLLIVGTKVDLEDSRCVSYDEGKEFADKYHALFYEGNK